MKRLFFLFLIALAGVGIALYQVWQGNQPVQVKTQPLPLFKPPFESYVAGAGIIEAASGNIPVGANVSGVVTRVFVKVGDKVKVGAPLFTVDDRDIKAQLVTAEARVKEAKTSYIRIRHHFETSKRLKNMNAGAISKESYRDIQDEVAQADAALALAKAQVKQLKLELERYTVRALIPGEILQCKMRQGEYVEAANMAEPLLIMGGNHRMNLRVDVDEQDAWRIKHQARAVAYVRGHPDLKAPLRYEYTEPYIVPKTALTGLSTERTDSRVLQVIYSLEPSGFPLYVGQQLDVFIEAIPDKNTPNKNTLDKKTKAP